MRACGLRRVLGLWVGGPVPCVCCLGRLLRGVCVGWCGRRWRALCWAPWPVRRGCVAEAGVPFARLPCGTRSLRLRSPRCHLVAGCVVCGPAGVGCGCLPCGTGPCARVRAGLGLVRVSGPCVWWV